MCYISYTNSANRIVTYDGRRVAGSLPAVEDMMDALLEIRSPSGAAYSFMTTSEVTALGRLMAEQDLFVTVSVEYII